MAVDKGSAPPPQPWAVCAHCPVLADCKRNADSLGAAGVVGIWAGTTGRQRRAARRDLLREEDLANDDDEAMRSSSSSNGGGAGRIFGAVQPGRDQGPTVSIGESPLKTTDRQDAHGAARTR